MTRRNRLALVVSLVSLLAAMHFTPVSACELGGSDSCECYVAPYAGQSANGMIVVSAVATPDTSDTGINVEAPMPDATSCAVASTPCETVGF